MLRQDDIEWGLVRLGVKPGDHLLVHSSLKSFGHVDGGADAVIDAILNVVGPFGTLLAPTYPFMGSVTVFLRQLKEIDLRTAPSLMGKITETLRLRPAAMRSIHPTHALAGIGAAAAELLGEHQLCDSPCGRLSPFGKLAEKPNGKVLLLGVTTAAMTLLHTAEEYFTPYIFIGETFSVPTTATDGAVHQVTVKGYCMNQPRNFPRFDETLERSGAINRVKIGESMATLIDAPAVIKLNEKVLKNDSRFLLGV